MKISGFHMHVYFDEAQTEQARELCERASDLFDISVGRIHSMPIGPHPKGSCQLGVPVHKFQETLFFLMQNRKDLTVFVHGLSGDDYVDHTELVVWLGDSQDLDLSIFADEMS